MTVTAIDAYDETGTSRTGTVWAQEVTPVGARRPFRTVPAAPRRAGAVCALSMFSPSFSPSGYRPSVGDPSTSWAAGTRSSSARRAGRRFRRGLPQASYATLRRVGVRAAGARPGDARRDQRPLPRADGRAGDRGRRHRSGDPDLRFGGSRAHGGGDARAAARAAHGRASRNALGSGHRRGDVLYNPKLLPRARPTSSGSATRNALRGRGLRGALAAGGDGEDAVEVDGLHEVEVEARGAAALAVGVLAVARDGDEEEPRACRGLAQAAGEL